MPLSVNAGNGNPRTVSTMYVYTAAAWRTVQAAWVMVGGVWKPFINKNIADLQFLLVGAGGAGGQAGGGGGGGFFNWWNYYVFGSINSINVTVGQAVAGFSGGNSTVASYSAFGGKVGDTASNNGTGPGNGGASGGAGTNNGGATGSAGGAAFIRTSQKGPCGGGGGGFNAAGGAGYQFSNYQGLGGGGGGQGLTLSTIDGGSVISGMLGSTTVIGSGGGGNVQKGCAWVGNGKGCAQGVGGTGAGSSNWSTQSGGRYYYNDGSVASMHGCGGGAPGYMGKSGFVVVRYSGNLSNVRGGDIVSWRADLNKTYRIFTSSGTLSW